jgi:three-Cys-motif partner protein
MAGLPEVGPWAKEKLDALARYLDFYTKVLKNQPWRTIYLDAYAGGGRAVVRTKERVATGGPSLFGDERSIDTEARELIDGSPRVALGIANPFDRYVLVDPAPDRATELEMLKVEFADTRSISILPMTAADGIAWVTAQPISRRTHRGPARLGEHPEAGGDGAVRGGCQLRAKHGYPAHAAELRGCAQGMGCHA